MFNICKPFENGIVILCFAFFATFQSCSLLAEPLPLVGSTIPPKSANRAGDLPGFIEVGSSALEYNAKNRTGISLVHGFIQGSPAFLTIRLFPDQSQQVLDAKNLPQGELEWKITKGEIKYSQGYRFSERCENEIATHKNNSPIWLIGLVKPVAGKSDCAHYSKRVLKAWGVNKQDGKISELSGKSVRCYYMSMDPCN